MIEIIAASGAVGAALTAALMLWIRNRRLKQELSLLRVQRALQWVITGQPPDIPEQPTPEERRRRFYLIKGGSAAALMALLASRITRTGHYARNHPALTASGLTAAAALCVVATVAAFHGTSDPRTQPPPSGATTSMAASPPQSRTQAATGPSAPEPVHSGTDLPAPPPATSTREEDSAALSPHRTGTDSPPPGPPSSWPTIADPATPSGSASSSPPTKSPAGSPSGAPTSADSPIEPADTCLLRLDLAWVLRLVLCL